ncbi:hypothetical protein OHB00_43195 [Streptomyces sp. NBC_00631]
MLTTLAPVLHLDEDQSEHMFEPAGKAGGRPRPHAVQPHRRHQDAQPPCRGPLVLEWDTLTASTDPDQQLVIRTAAPGTPTHEGLRVLASWAARSPQSTPGTTS